MHTVVQVKPTDDFKVYVYFDDGKIKLYDAQPIINAGGVFKKISDIETFKQLCTVMNGTLAWDVNGNFDVENCLDIDPETIYERAQDVVDPLSAKVI